MKLNLIKIKFISMSLSYLEKNTVTEVCPLWPGFKKGLQLIKWSLCLRLFWIWNQEEITASQIRNSRAEEGEESYKAQI